MVNYSTMTVRAQITFQSVTAMPEDAVVNTMHFTGDATGSGSIILDKVRQFYLDGPPNGGKTIAQYLSPDVSRVGTPMMIELYFLGDPEPRQPFATGFYTLPPPDLDSALPGEVAACVSWKAQPVSGVKPQSTRGRNFIGPLTAEARNSIQGQPCRPGTTFINALASTAGRLVAEVDAFPLVIHSQPGLAAAVDYPVTNGYVDNAFDTMRSRGPAPSARTSF